MNFCRRRNLFLWDLHLLDVDYNWNDVNWFTLFRLNYWDSLCHLYPCLENVYLPFSRFLWFYIFFLFNDIANSFQQAEIHLRCRTFIEVKSCIFFKVRFDKLWNFSSQQQFYQEKCFISSFLFLEFHHITQWWIFQRGKSYISKSAYFFQTFLLHH